MYICICHAVTDSAIHKAVSGGVSSFRGLRSATGCGTQCGCCVAQAREVMNEALADQGLEASREQLRVVSSI
ncbi:MAG: (2Fe-2S)-binding protein [Xanthomonadales bacterium]